MVKVQQPLPLDENGAFDTVAWVERISCKYPHIVKKTLARSVSELENRFPEEVESALPFADLVAALNMDTASITAALFYRPLRKRAITRLELSDVIGMDGSNLAMAVVNTGDSSLLELSNSRMLSSEARDQVENIRRMLVSMIDDARVAVLKLAERVVAMRMAKEADEQRKKRIAEEAGKVFAPLAGRLGIWQLKWELEDLSLRYLEPDAYMRIARQLAGRREQREQQVEELVGTVQKVCKDSGVQAIVHGRAKNIYSIWRKMRSKNIGFEEVYDVRAVRVIVPDIAQCYTTLGIIHTHWQHIPHEFDDYVASPKENGYRSIHTAVIDAQGHTFEVQIRTEEMHEESELGVCAHWSYKGETSEEQAYTDKMNWLRQVVEWQDEVGASASLSDELDHRVREERIFINTPKGHVLDLMSGATVLDFAFRVHTEVGYHCTGATVDGRRVALNTPLLNGQRVEVLQAPVAQPSRDWLNIDLGYIHTTRARSKVQAFFKSLSDDENRNAGKSLLSATLDRLNLRHPTSYELQSIADRLHFESVDQMYYGLALSECQIRDVLEIYLRVTSLDTQAQLSLLPDAQEGENTFKLKTIALNRDGLLLDVTRLLSEKHTSLLSASGSINAQGQALLDIEVTLSGLVELSILIDQIRQIPDVVDVYRQKPY
jgi:GTP pyrophosphokinase